MIGREEIFGDAKRFNSPQQLEGMVLRLQNENATLHGAVQSAEARNQKLVEELAAQSDRLKQSEQGLVPVTSRRIISELKYATTSTRG